MQKRKQPEPDEAAGAPEWMVTFSDCMTLLLTFFVLLLSFSSFDENFFRKLRVVFAQEFSSVSSSQGDKSAFLATDLIVYPDELDKGSEKPTLTKGREDNIKEDTEPVNFHDRKEFSVSSDEVFWGNGTVISSRGRKILSDMASFLREVPGRTVISENGPAFGSTAVQADIGLQRSWAVIEYFTTQHGLDKLRFSISAASMLAKQGAQENRNNREPPYRQAKAKRMLEIVLLERSIYN